MHRNNDEYWHIIQAKKQQNDIETVFSIVRSAAIEPVLLKGWAIGRFYPAGRHRYSTDVDIAVASKDYDNLKNCITHADLRSTVVDMHSGLRKLDLSTWEDLFERSKLIDMNGTAVRVLSDEDNLRCVCIHWLADGGNDRERLWDIYYGVNNRSPNFDWQKFFDPAGPVRTEWLKISIALAAKYLDLDTTRLPFDASAEIIPNWVIKTLEKEWKSGVKLGALHLSLNDPGELWRQIIKRIPPNAIQSTVEAEARFDGSMRLPLQIRSIFRRISPSFQRVFYTNPIRIIFNGLRKNRNDNTGDRIGDQRR